MATEITITEKIKVYTTTVETLLFSFSGSEASVVYTLLPGLVAYTLSLVFSREWYTPDLFLL